MIENHRTGLLWKLFMSVPEVQAGLRRLGFSEPASRAAGVMESPRANGSDREYRYAAAAMLRERLAWASSRAPGLRPDREADRGLHRRLAGARPPTTRIRTTSFTGSGTRRSSSTRCACSSRLACSAQRGAHALRGFRALQPVLDALDGRALVADRRTGAEGVAPDFDAVRARRCRSRAGLTATPSPPTRA